MDRYGSRYRFYFREKWSWVWCGSEKHFGVHEYRRVRCQDSVRSPYRCESYLCSSLLAENMGGSSGAGGRIRHDYEVSVLSMDASRPSERDTRKIDASC